MKINPLLAGSAIVYALAGLALTFAPDEVMNALRTAPSGFGAWVAQLLGGALLGLAYLNWLQRYAIVGGVLGRPVLFTNIMFLSVGFFASLNAFRHHTTEGALGVAVVLGSILVPFGLRLITAPPCATGEP